MKICTKCKLEKDESEFNKKTKSSKDGLSTYCKDCNKLKLKEHYLNNKDKYIIKVKKQRSIIKEYINSFKVACQECGEAHIACLDFHHNEDKEFNISIANLYCYSLEKIKKEIDKCTILCSNCHRKHHYNEKQSLLV